MSHHALPLIQRFMDKSSPGGAYLVHGKGGLPESILVGKDEKIILDCNSVFCVEEAQMNALKSRMDGGLSDDHNVSTSLWVSSASQSIDHITKQPKAVHVCLRLSFLIILSVLFVSFKSLCRWM